MLSQLVVMLEMARKITAMIILSNLWYKSGPVLKNSSNVILYFKEPIFSPVDECIDGDLNDCDANAVCNDLEDGFECTCNDGYTGSGTECIAIEPGINYEYYYGMFSKIAFFIRYFFAQIKG